MDTNTLLIGVAGVFLILYLLRRRSRCQKARGYENRSLFKDLTHLIPQSLMQILV